MCRHLPESLFQKQRSVGVEEVSFNADILESDFYPYGPHPSV